MQSIFKKTILSTSSLFQLSKYLFLILGMTCIAGCITSGLREVSSEVIKFDGPITAETASDFFAIVKPTTKQIIISSGGGDVEAGLKIAQYMSDRSIDIVVDGICVSSCANYLFLAANRKTVLPGSWLGFHGGAKTTIANIKSIVDKLEIDGEKKNLVESQLIEIGAKEELFFSKHPGGSIVSKSSYFINHPKVKNTVEKIRKKNVVWLPTKEELEVAGVKNISSFWYPSHEERKELSERYNGNLISSKDVEE